MIEKLLIFSLVFILCVTYFISDSESLLSKSIQLVGVQTTRQQGLDGQGIKIGIIDTGIDFSHPDLYGYGQSGRVAGGYDYVNADKKPNDVNGHGTEVAGIIGANGSFSGMAPKSQLFSYKVSSTGESVSSDYIIQAISLAIDEKMGVINISLGVNRTNDELENAVDEAVKKGIVVVTAAGNNGPDDKTIGSPGRDYNVITVGASYNNITSSVVSTLEIGDKQYDTLPMLGTNILKNPIQGKIIYGGYGRNTDLENIDVKDAILLEQRGSDIKGEKVYFSEKEKNAADHGAIGLIIFNNQSGVFFGELIGPNSTRGYQPRIPVISMSGDDGLKLRSILKDNAMGNLDVFYHPDFVAPFSSRGSVSPFYVKPDLVAPGVYVNTTTIGGKYNLTSGTSIAAPHVTGAVAILLQKYPSMDPASIASLIITTTDPVTDAHGKIFPIDVAGSGRLNVTRASSANLIIEPHDLVFNLSYDNPSETRTLHLNPIDNTIPKLKVQFLSNEPSLDFSYGITNNTINAKITDDIKKPNDYEGFIIIDDSKTAYRIPVLVHVTKGTLDASQADTQINFSINYPDKWSYAKISLTKAGSHDTRIVGITPQDSKTITIDSAGEYWVQADIKVGNVTDHAYHTLMVNHISENHFDIENILQIPIKQVIIVSGIFGIMLLVVLIRRR
ncbi:putative Subtilase family protein [Nitrosotalea devaniterrae]|uniref:Putative Subtilase family protein n=1 Tax=Nitrosotalea devaniterrae TaxID=1078905 RepID=A0A128A174_9ARCH|nr:putative Subtilase family protein [Candidatus Nitrosotalea devanaterra]